MIPDKCCRLIVNGKARTWPGGSIDSFLRAEGMDPAAAGIAVALNGTVVPRKAWPDTQLDDGDRLELVGIFKGG